jgi:FlgD Ig-like domain
MRTRTVLVSGSVVLGVVLYSVFSGTGAPGIPEKAPGEVGIIYSDAALEENAAVAITPRVYGSAVNDSVPGRYRYTVTLVNEPSSSNVIWKFVLDPVPRPITVTPPPNWMWAYGYQLKAKALAFGSEGDNTPRPGNWDSVSAVPSIHDLPPGDSVTFRYVSDGVPSMIRFYVQGFYNDSLGTEDQGGLPPYSVYTKGITGTVVGPATTTGVPETPRTPPEAPKLQAPAPNPTSASATVAFYLPRPANVRLTVHDVSGRAVAVLASRNYPAGYHSAIWKGFSSVGKKMPAGVYFFRLAVDGKPAGAQKMIMVR